MVISSGGQSSKLCYEVNQLSFETGAGVRTVGLTDIPLVILLYSFGPFSDTQKNSKSKACSFIPGGRPSSGQLLRKCLLKPCSISMGATSNNSVSLDY